MKKWNEMDSLPPHKDGADRTQTHEEPKPGNDRFHYINASLGAFDSRGIGNLHMDFD